MPESKITIKTKRKFWGFKTIILTLALVILATSAIGGTVAWLSSKTEPVINKFTYGDINITLTETITEDGDDKDNTNSYKMLPGETIIKDPKVTVEENSENCYLFVQLEKTTNFDDFMKYEMLEEWTILEGYDNVYYQEVTKSEEKQEFNIIKDNKVIVKDEVTKDMLNALDEEGIENYPKLTVYAYAVQRNSEIETISTPTNAWSLVLSESV